MRIGHAVWLLSVALSGVVMQTRTETQSGNRTLTAVPGIKVGHHVLSDRPTGCTVILTEGGAVAGVDARGGAPASRETDLLDPVNRVQQVHGIALSGGSAWGLESASGAMRYLEEQEIGHAFGRARVPIVPGASIFDLGVGDPRIRPTADCGYRAAKAASSAPVTQGSVGAGAGATVGKAAGAGAAMKGGIGSAALIQDDGLIVAALVVLNAYGDIIDPATGRIVAGARGEDGRSFVDARKLLRAGKLRFAGEHNNSTLGVISTNARLTKTQATRVAELAHDGLARAISPVHTYVDGDIVFALSTGTRTDAVDVGLVGALAAEVLADAVVRAASEATGLPNIPAVRDLK